MNERLSRGNSNEQQPATSADTETSYEREAEPRPQIYVVCLAAHSRGDIHGVWLDAAREPDEVYEDIHAMLADSPAPDAEEFAIHDAEDFGSCTIHEHDSIELVSKIARGIKQHGFAFAAWADVQEGYPELLDHFSEAYTGHFSSLDAYAEQEIAERGYSEVLDRVVPVDWRQYVKIDARAMANDWHQSGDINVYRDPEGGVYVFDERV